MGCRLPMSKLRAKGRARSARTINKGNKDYKDNKDNQKHIFAARPHSPSHYQHCDVRETPEQHISCNLMSNAKLV